jgi:hypothetical protein
MPHCEQKQLSKSIFGLIKAVFGATKNFVEVTKQKGKMVLFGDSSLKNDVKLNLKSLKLRLKACFWAVFSAKRGHL